jgi:hypothetical protein
VEEVEVGPEARSTAAVATEEVAATPSQLEEVKLEDTAEDAVEAILAISLVIVGGRDAMMCDREELMMVQREYFWGEGALSPVEVAGDWLLAPTSWLEIEHAIISNFECSNMKAFFFLFFFEFFDSSLKWNVKSTTNFFFTAPAFALWPTRRPRKTPLWE